jgi:DNA mismatch repair protein MutL
MYNRLIMSDVARIKILPEAVASAIAAGEVIERPASVVKELVENALDAGATRIAIEIDQAGTARIAVQDNGHGIHSDDVVLAVERYATSKLQSPADLFNIRTLGFRGEALSSIAAVSRLELITRSHDEARGTHLKVEGGEILDKGSIGSPPGTHVTIRDLFFNVPARRKFIKSERTERRRINQVVHRFALANPQVAFSLSQEGRQSFESSGRGDMREILARVFDLELAREMIELPVSDEGEYQIHGFVSPPHLNRSNRQEITFFVNGRWIQDAGLKAAVLQAYHTLLMVGRYPITVLSLKLPPDQVDVNVHPAKAEVRFQDPQKIFSLLQRAVRATLLGQAAPPRVNFQERWQGLTSEDSHDWQFANQAPLNQSLLPPSGHKVEADAAVPLLRSVGQVGKAYLVAEGPDGIYLIDQHAAHERILFERYMDELNTNQLESQALLEAITLEFSRDEMELLRQNSEQLQGMGFALEEFGAQTFRLRSVPAIFLDHDPEEAIRAVVGEFEEDEAPLASKREALLAGRICKRLAIKSGQLLSLEEQRELIRALELCTSPRTCPHGRPTMIHLPVSTLARQFGRT